MGHGKNFGFIHDAERGMRAGEGKVTKRNDDRVVK